ncbi:hypothetical protein F1880_008066 [Penicillium rolfsii]|nr:hypothetical protein F1880_008066 [Penicillium rolfsii]
MYQRLKSCMVARENHFMKLAMVDSQLNLLDDSIDEPDEPVLDADHRKEDVLDDVVQTVDIMPRV